MINDAWLNWLCTLYQLVPDYAKRFVLTILQWQTDSGEYPQLSRAVAQMSLNYPLKPDEINDRNFLEGSDEQLQNLFRGLAEALPGSRRLSDKLIRQSISRQLHYHPGENSVLVPEKVLLGGPAFLHHATAEQYKTVIFDLVSTSTAVLNNRIDEQIKQGIKPDMVKMLLADCSATDLQTMVKTLYFYWLATHQDSNSGGPIWLCSRYSVCCVTRLPTCGQYFVSPDGTRKVHLPAQLIKEYFGQPEAEVVDGDEFLVLLDEFLGLISA